MDRFTRPAAQFFSEININKTECLYQPMRNLDPAPEPKPLTINQETLPPTMIAQIQDGKCKCRFWKTTGQAMERPACVYWSQLQGQSSCCLFFPPVWCWNMGHISESSEQAPCLYDGTAKSNNERTMEGQDHECGNSLPYRTNFNDWCSHSAKSLMAGSRA